MEASEAEYCQQWYPLGKVEGTTCQKHSTLMASKLCTVRYGIARKVEEKARGDCADQELGRVADYKRCDCAVVQYNLRILGALDFLHHKAELAHTDQNDYDLVPVQNVDLHS